MRGLVPLALLLACGGKAVPVDSEEPDDEDPASICKEKTQDQLAEAELLAVGGHLHRGLVLAEDADRGCSSAGSRWMIAEMLADLGLDARAIAAYQRYGREARTEHGRDEARRAVDLLRKRPPPVRPQASDDDRATALALYRDGVNLRLGKKYDAAIRQLRRSYALLPHPLTIAQIALAHEDAGDAVEALKAHERALAIAEDLAGTRAVPRLLRGHVAPAVALAWSRDGRRLASAGRDELVAVWEPATGRILLGLVLAQPTAVAISADGTVVAAAGRRGDVTVWDAVSGAVRSSFPPGVDWWSSVALSPDGAWVAAGSDQGVVVRPSAGGDVVARIPIGSSQMTLDFTPDGGRLVLSRGNQIQIWERGGARPLLAVETTERVVGLALGPDGKRLAAVDGSGALTLWELPSGRRLRSLPYDFGVAGLAWSADGSVLAASTRHEIRLWDAATLEVRRTITAGAAVLALSPDGATVAGGSEAVVKTWETATGEPGRPLGSQVDGVVGVRFSADGRLLAVASTTGVDLWALDAVREPRRIELAGQDLRRLALDPRGHWAAVVGAAGTAHLIGVRAAAVDLRWGLDGCTGVATRADGDVLAWVSDHRLQLDDPLTGHRRLGFGYSDDHGMQAVAFSPDGQQIATGSAGTLRLLLTSGKHIWEGKVDAAIDALAWSPAGDRLAGAMADGSLRLWTPDRIFDPPAVVPAGPERLDGVAFSSDGALLATAAADGHIQLWDGRTGAARAELGKHAAAARSVAFSPSGRLLASGGDDGVVLLWDPVAGKRVATLSTAGGQWLVLADDGRIDGASGRAGGAGRVYWLVGAIALPGVTGWDRAHTPGLLRDLFAATGRSRPGRSSATGR
ncbi:MAG TPA: hypothetical protein VL172_19220 [Kofleriaceae bacterium]|nr:hypothetical protein [Kofleriaceae bacterium]